ncbi:uncharacterized protein LOC133387687 [Rhineura floridana]|uniref:uncharacterized protein LOC133387687 n=1 Tax=Rhineura floridana TaxID=261503 RepID=UPI002AC7E7C1|nr:uncharacterized protein LOC133387687 [Rhineura floridana]
MRASASASVFSRAAMMWLDDLLEDPNPDPASLRRSLIKLRKTAVFVADATLDATQLGARAMTAQIVARRTLWLRHWQADPTSRGNLSRAPYSGSLLFGEEALKAVLVDPKDAHKPVLATVKNIDHRPFRRFPPFRTNQPFRRPQPGGRGRDFRSYDSSTFRGTWNRRFHGRGPRLACQLRQKPSPTNPTPTTSRGNVGHPAGNGLLGSRSHHCHHKHCKVPDTTNIRRHHASRQSARDVHLYNPHCAMGSSPHLAPSMDSVAISTGHCQLQPSQSSFEPCTAPLLPLVDQGSTPLQGHVVQRTPQNRCNRRCQPHRLGSPLNSQYVQEVWSTAEQTQSINWLELKAVHLALRHFQSLFPLDHVLIRTDNMCVKSHLNRQGGTRSRPLQDLASLIFVWAEQHLQSLKAEHLRGIWNVIADWLSRQQVFPGEWKLHPDIFHRLQCRFGAFSVDLFASSHNCQLPRYFARYLDSTAEAVDALTTPWPDGLL